MSQSKIRRTYKDSLFRMIFREKKELLSLYNAVNRSNYQNPEELEVNVLEDVIYMGMKNDVSFIIDVYMNLYEAQSTWNPNMPLRGVFYFADLYQGYVEQKGYDIYGTVQLPLPLPKYLVFYNGTRNIGEITRVRLSESFQGQNGEEPALECVATYLNINYGHNQEIMSQCRKLYEYSYLIEEIRKHLGIGYKLEIAVDHAVEHCIQNGILEDFLRTHRAEVTNVILTEYNEERHIRNEKEISFQEGKNIGLQEGKNIGLQEGEDIGLQKGMKAFVEVLADMEMEREEILERLIQKFAVTRQQAEKILEKVEK